MFLGRGRILDVEPVACCQAIQKDFFYSSFPFVSVQTFWTLSVVGPKKSSGFIFNLEEEETDNCSKVKGVFPSEARQI